MDNAGQQTAAVPRKPIPPEMWTAILHAENAHHDKERAFFLTLRAELIRIGAKYRFTENELERRGIIKTESRAAEYFGKGQRQNEQRTLTKR